MFHLTIRIWGSHFLGGLTTVYQSCHGTLASSHKGIGATTHNATRALGVGSVVKKQQQWCGSWRLNAKVLSIPKDVEIPESLHELGHEWHFFPLLATGCQNNPLKELRKDVESVPNVCSSLLRSA